MSDKTRIEAELDLLASLESGEAVSQQGLAKRVLVSVGMVNALLKRAVTKGYVKVTNVPSRRYIYFLTPKGFLEKSRLVAEYLDASLEFVRMATDGYAKIFRRAAAVGHRRVVLVGAGELADLAQTAARDTGMEIVGLFEPGSNQARLHGLQVLAHARDLSLAAPDILVVTASRKPQASHDAVEGLLPHVAIHAPDFLRVRTSQGDTEIGGAA